MSKIKVKKKKREDLPLHRKYRPKKLDDIIGNEAIIASLRTLLKKKKGRPTTYLLSGPAGCGKTTLSRIIASELKAVGRDVKELNISNTRGIGEARKIIDGSSFAPLGGKSKVYILNECHKSTDDFQNAMLEILEEPPKNTYFILCTTEPARLKATIRQRCTSFQVEAILKNNMKKFLMKILKWEKKENFPAKGIKQIISYSEGSPRQALVFLDAVLGLKDEDSILEAIRDITTSQIEVIELCRSLYQGTTWSEVSKLLKGITADAENVRYALLGYFGSILLSSKDKKSANRCVALIELFTENFMYSGKPALYSSCYLATLI